MSFNRESDGTNGEPRLIQGVFTPGPVVALEVEVDICSAAAAAVRLDAATPLAPQILPKNPKYLLPHFSHSYMGLAMRLSVSLVLKVCYLSEDVSLSRSEAGCFNQLMGF